MTEAASVPGSSAPNRLRASSPNVLLSNSSVNVCAISEVVLRLE